VRFPVGNEGSLVAYNMAALLDPQSIAIIGASADLDRIGGLPIKLLTEAGFERVFAVNPKYDRIASYPCYKSIEDVPEPVDLVVLATGAKDSLDLLRRSHAKGARAAIIFASGFAETGQPETLAMQAAIADFAVQSGMAIAGPNCVGIVNWKSRVFATFARAFQATAAPGRNALIGQSGNIASAIYRIARRMNLGFSYAINTGNEACLEISSYLDHLADDTETDAILCYVESLRDGPAFIAAARRLRQKGKLLAVFKAGSSEKGAEAARSHTASLAGDRAAYNTAFRAAGVAVAQDLSHLADLAYIHQFGLRLHGGRVGIVSVSGGAGIILSDGLSAGDLTIPTLPLAVQATLKSIIPAYGMVTNPVDLTGNVANATEHVYAVLHQILASGSIDILLIYLGGRSLAKCVDSLRKIATETDELIVVIDTFESGLRNEIESFGIAYFEDLAQAARAVDSYCAWRLAALPTAAAPAAIPVIDGKLLDRFAPGSRLSEVDSKAFLAACGIPVVRDVVVPDASSAVREADRLGYPVVLKLVSPDVQHKTEIGAVKLGLAGPAEVERAYEEILANAAAKAPHARVEGIAVESQVLNARELLVGVVKDPVFGWLMTVGLGGIWTELIGDVVHALLPVDETAALAMLRRLKTFALLDGFRGEPRADVVAASRAIAQLSAAVLAYGDRLAECELNPVLVRPAGRGVIAADALITLAPITADTLVTLVPPASVLA
jgi:acyl-CoA synthetase (NDP forming)